MSIAPRPTPTHAVGAHGHPPGTLITPHVGAHGHAPLRS
jgi:hypothetical protein